MNDVTCFNFMISCPSDIKSELTVVKKAFDDFNDQTGSVLNVRIDFKHWRKNTYPESGGTPQELINRQLLEDADAVIAIFGNKVGSPTKNYDSGTIEEIEKMIIKGRNVFVYFSDKPVRKSETDPEEEARLRNFKDAYKNRGIYFEYQSNAELRELLRRHLILYFKNKTEKEYQAVGSELLAESSQYRLLAAEQKPFELVNQIKFPALSKKNHVKRDVQEEYDVFISHAWEDKESFVDEFVAALKANGIKPWYDTSKMKWGDSMREKIDNGLKKSKVGIVILSPNYINNEKYWTKTELDGLFQIESVNGKTILPIWHNLTKKQVMEYSPIVANKIAINTTLMAAEEIAKEVASILSK